MRGLLGLQRSARRRRWLMVLYALWGIALLSSCGELGEKGGGEHGEKGGGLEPAATNVTLHVFQKPFQVLFLENNSAPFDHDLPLSFRGDPGNNYMLTWWGGRLQPLWNGHNGHDWNMPEGTPIVAVADGQVVFADFEPPFDCGTLGEVSALVVRIRHAVSGGEMFDSVYAHLSRIDVVQGQIVPGGQRIGLSGMTGCTNGPHLHFGVLRLTHTNNGRPTPVDPFGWQGPGVDPWAQHPDGAASLWLWKEGEAPPGGQALEPFFSFKGP